MRRPSVTLAVLGICLGVFLLPSDAATNPLEGLPIVLEDDVACSGNECGDVLEVHYLGTSGVVFRYGDDAILTAPYFSNVGLVASASLRELKSDHAAINRYMPEVPDARAVLIGHAHYDHLMDLPFLLKTKLPEVKLLGSRTAANLLAPFELGDLDFEIVNGREGDAQQVGEWIPIVPGKIRAMALRSGHAAHFRGIKLFSGRLDKPRETLPTRARHWLEGQTYAYLIDFLDPDGKSILRIHFQDAASNAPLGFPPPLPEEEERAIDLAVLCVASFHETENYPGAFIAATHPRQVVLTHWEDFFRPLDKPLRPVPATDVRSFLVELRESFENDPERTSDSFETWRTMPAPGTRLFYRKTATGRWIRNPKPSRPRN